MDAVNSNDDVDVEEISRQNNEFTTRDQRVQIHTLHTIGWTYRQIATQLQLSVDQVGYAVRHANIYLTPQKRSGRPPILTTAQVEELITFVSASKRNRRIAWHRLPTYLN